MTRTPQGTPSRRSGRPGRLLLKVAHFVFHESVVADVVLPTISDMQSEMRSARNRSERMRAALRGYAAFWTLVLAAPVAFHMWPTRRVGESGAADRNPGFYFWLIVATVVLSAWNALGAGAFLLGAGGVAFAMMIHRWNHGHPTELVIPEKGVWMAPEINQSKIKVDGNIAGLMYVVGSMAVVLLGLPVARWFILVAAALAVVSAVAIVRWRRAHPTRLISIT